LVVNPNDLAGVAEAIHHACVMPVEEKRARMKLLRDVVRTYNVQGWAESFLEMALGSTPVVTQSSPSAPEGNDFPLSATSAIVDQRIA
jgi:trehalose-6-phosphate synthase